MMQFLFGFLLYLASLVTSWNGYQHAYLSTPPGDEIHLVQADNPQSPIKEPLILFHGLGSQAADLYSVMQPLRSYFSKLIAVDLPGHGLTQMPVANQPWPQIQEHFFTTLHKDIQQKRRQVVIWGNSLGGWTAIQYALRYPEDVKALILVSPAGAEESATQSQHLSDIFLNDSQNNPQKLIPLLFNQAPAGADLFAVALKARFGTPGLQAVMSQLTPDNITFTKAQLQSVSVPTLLIWGKADRIFPQEAAYFKSNLPARYTTIIEPENFTHSPYIESPMENELSQITLDWLKRLK